MFAIDNVGSQLRRAETLGRHGRHPDHAMSGTLSTQFHAYLRARHPQAAGEGGAAGETQVALWDRFGLTAEVFAAEVAGFTGLERVSLRELMAALPAVSRVIFKACKIGTPLVTSVPSVRAKREIAVLRFKLPKSGMRSLKLSMTSRPLPVRPTRL